MIQVFKPKIRTDEVIQELKKILDTGWIGLGPKTKEFEQEVGKYLNCSNFIATNSCTSALYLAIKCLNLPAKSKIITTPITFVSTNSVILYEGHLPVFCDVEPLTGNISVDSIEKAIKFHNGEIKAIMLVHMGGYPCDMDKINEIAEKNNIKIIEDCAHAFGATYKGKTIGDSSNVCVWSFQAVKNLPVGDGGGISTKDEKMAERIKRLIWLGIDKTTIERSSLDSIKQSYNWDYDVTELGFKYHLNDIISTIGLIQLKHIGEDNARRKEIVNFYKTHLNKDKCTFPEYNLDRTSSYHFFPLFFENRGDVYKRLSENEIYPGMHYKRNDQYELFAPYKGLICGELTAAKMYQEKELTLPLHMFLTNNDLEKIVDVINNG